jgi:carbonic anhydrase
LPLERNSEAVSKLRRPEKLPGVICRTDPTEQFHHSFISSPSQQLSVSCSYVHFVRYYSSITSLFYFNQAFVAFRFSKSVCANHKKKMAKRLPACNYEENFPSVDHKTSDTRSNKPQLKATYDRAKNEIFQVWHSIKKATRGQKNKRINVKYSVATPKGCES